jgi:hypothetical protein
MTALAATDDALTALTKGTSGLQVATLAVPRHLEIPFVQIFRPDQRFTLSISSGKIGTFLSLFESVKFVSLTFAVEVTGQSGKLQFAATALGSPPADDNAWLSATVYQRFTGNAHGDTYAEYRFPSTHPFGTELKAVALGNDPPKFYFRFLGTTGDTASIRGALVLQGGGTGIIPAIGLNIYASPKRSDNDSAVGGI